MKLFNCIGFLKFKYMNSSTGFKKRSLLRPPSGNLTNQKQYLKAIDISQNESMISSNIKNELTSIQQQINLLDKDKRIRTGEVSLEKSYILNIKKYLKDMQVQPEKQEDDIKIMKHMNVDSYQTGFRKLWKLINYLDIMISKMTELQMVQFLKYDEGFLSIANDSPNGQRIVQIIAKGGFNLSSFYLSQISLERYQELYATASGLKRQNFSASSSRGFMKETHDNTSELIEELRVENRKLTELINQIEQQRQLEKQKAKQKQNRVAKVENGKQKSPANLFEELEEKYKGQFKSLNEKISLLNNQIIEQRIKIQTLESQLKAAEEELKRGEHKENIKPKSGSYEEALLEEMNKMKSGFERKIQRILEEFQTKERESRKREYEMKTDNDKLKWQKNLLMKKFETMSVA